MDSTDKIVVAVLAAAKAAADKKETPGQYVLEYERMLRVFERRAQIAAKKQPGAPPPSPPAG